VTPLVTLPISSAGSPTNTTYAFPGSATFTATLLNVGDIVVLPMFGGYTTEVESWAVTGTGGVTSPNGPGTLYQSIEYFSVPNGFDMELWYGIVTATGSATFTATYSAALDGTGYLLQEWTTASPAHTLWTVLPQAAVVEYNGTVVGTTVAYPSVTPPAAGAAYVGYATANSTLTAGTTSGYTWANDGGNGEYCLNAACTAATQSPICTQATANDGYGSIGALVLASPTPQNGLIVRQAVKRSASR
jgi:hypothetical protein